MTKRIIGILAIVVLLVGIVTTLYAGEPCRDYFTKCVNGGCGTLITAKSCKMTCQVGNITCVNDIAPIE